MKVSNRTRAASFAFVAMLTGIFVVGATPALAASQVPNSTAMVNGKVFGMDRVGNTLYIAGQFTKVLNPSGVGGYAANNLAAIDMTTGLGIPSFHPSVTSSTGTALIRDVAASPDGQSLFIGGTFDNAAGASVLNLAKIDIPTQQGDPNFHPQVGTATSIVYGLLVSPTRLYFGGEFLTVNGANHKRLGSVALDGTLDTAFKAQFGSKVRSMIFAPDGQTMFVAGRFTAADNQPRHAVARISPVTGALDPWAIPDGVIEVPQQAFSMQATATTLYVGLGAHPNYAAAFALNNGNVGTRIWRYDTVGNVQQVQIDPAGTGLFIGGHFGTGALQQRVCGNIQLHGLAKLVLATGQIDCTWEPQLAPFGSNFQGGWTFLMTDTDLWVGGGFTSVNGATRKNLAEFSLFP